MYKGNLVYICLIISLFFKFSYLSSEDVNVSEKSAEVLPKALTGDALIAKQILDALNINGGLCLHLDCGRMEAPGLTASLAELSSLLVHGLAFDDNSLNRARNAIDLQGVAGRAMAERWTEKTLPYLSELAKIIVIEDMGAIKTQGITPEEILRVLAPNGKLCVKEGGKWVVTIKPRPKELDEWTHNHHGADGNLVSNDKAITFPLNLRWLDGLPNHRGGFGDCAGCRAMIIAGGRCYTVSVDDIGNLMSNKNDAYLMARDAFNGLPLWKINCNDTYDTTALDWRNVWPLVASDKKVYTPRSIPTTVKNPTTKKDETTFTYELLIIDGATGKVEVGISTKFQVKRLLLVDGCLIAASWEKTGRSKHTDGFENDAIRAVWWPSDGGAIDAYDAENGKVRWSIPQNALTMAASDGVFYYLTTKGNPPTSREVVAIEISTGKEKWRVPHTSFGEDPDTCLNFAGPNCVVLSKSKGVGKREVNVLSAVDGKVIYNIPNATARAIVGNELWCNNGRYEIKTGKKLIGPGLGSTYAGTNIVGGCIPPIVIGKNLVTSSRGGGFTQFLENPEKPPLKLTFAGARGACISGMVPANGMLYTAQNNCACMGVQVGGILAIAPSEESPKKEDFLKQPVIEKGPAFGKLESTATVEEWPTYRQNNERRGSVNTNLPEALKVLWKIPCAKLGDGPFIDAWNARIGSAQPLTAPIIAAETLFIAGVNSGQVMALSPLTGALIWKVTLGSRIDSPPTYYKGLLFVGCHDGWVYVLKAKDGALFYRLRLAPRERRLVAYGSVESIWPVAGSVMIHEEIAYASAGRTTKTDGGILMIAFKPESGEMIWTKNYGTEKSFQNNIFSVQDGELVWQNMRFDLKTGNDLAPTQLYYGNSGILDGSWSAGFSKHSGRGLVLGKACSSMMTWNDKILVFPASAINRSSAIQAKPAGPSAIKHPDGFKKDELIWSTILEPYIEWARVNAMVLTGNTVLFAGSVHNGWNNNRYDGSFIWIKSATDGKTKQKEIKLDSPAIFDGFAVANGRAYLALQDGTLMCLGE